MVTGDEVERGKPDPEPYLLGARRTDTDPSNCVVVEDSPAGIAAGKAAGMRVAAIMTTHHAFGVAPGRRGAPSAFPSCPPPPPLGSMKVLRVLESALYVDDLDRAVAFFRDVLGLEAMVEAPGRLVALNAGGSTVLLLFHRGSTTAGLQSPGGWIPPHDGAGPVHMAFAIEDAACLGGAPGGARRGNRKPCAVGPGRRQPLLPRSRRPFDRACHAGDLANLVIPVASGSGKPHPPIPQMSSRASARDLVAIRISGRASV